MAEPANLSALPQELIRIILGYSCNLEGLLSAVASCRALYDAFHTFPAPIVAQLVQKEVCHATLRHAILCLKAARYRDGSSDIQLPDFVRGLICEIKASHVPDFEWTLNDGIEAIRLHRAIRNMAQMLASDYISQLRVQVGTVEDAASDTELSRIQKALYRFEMFRFLFPEPRHQPSSRHPKEERERVQRIDAAKIIFFTSSEPWGNEQLSAVYESLFLRVAKIFNDIAMHDIVWGKRQIECAHDMSDIFVNSILYQGIRFVKRLLEATTYKDQIQILGPEPPEGSNGFLDAAFADFALYSLENRAKPTQDYRQEGNKTLEEKEDDAGPATVWLWAKNEEPGNILPMGEFERPLRACGYVFWDLGRWDKNGFMQQEWMDVEIDLSEPIFDDHPPWEEMERSFRMRAKLYFEGYRGYWDEYGDAGYMQIGDGKVLK